MIQINLLPHREIKRRMRQRMFITGTAASVTVGLMVAILGHMFFQRGYDNQQKRNQYLTANIAILDGKISQIKQLKEEIEALLARKKVVETLQSSRTETVHLLDELVRQMPDGVHLKTMRQTGTKITLEGFAQSNARVSTLMENLERSPWLAGAELLESRQVTLNNQRLHEFSLDVQIKYDASQDVGTHPTGAVSPTAPAPVAAAGAAPIGVGNNNFKIPPVPLPAPKVGSSTVTPLPIPSAFPSEVKKGGSPAVVPIPPKTTVMGLPIPSAVGQSVTQTISSAAAKRGTP